MSRLLDRLPDARKKYLHRILSSTDRIADRHSEGTDSGAAAFCAAIERRVAIIEHWLLDDEQKAVLAADPEDVPTLYAATAICALAAGDGFKGRSTADFRESSVQTDPVSQTRRRLESALRNSVGFDWQAAETAAFACLTGESEFEGEIEAPDPAAERGTTLPLIRAAVRLSLELDLAPDTAAQRIGPYMPPGGDADAGEMAGRFDLLASGPHPTFPGTIQVKLRCRHPEVHRALKHHERSVQRMLNGINRSVRPRFLYSDVIYEIEPDGYAPADMRFSVDSSAALQLFMGNRLYSDKRVYLRELIQNAIDACNLRRMEENDYQPSIHLKFNEDISVVTVRDNGIGMDRQWIEKYFLKIGISFYQSDDIRGMNKDARFDVSFISQFGIGFLSSFLVSDKIVIKTRKPAGAGLMITITDLEDYFDVRSLEADFPAGTEVSVFLKPSAIDYCRSLEYLGYLKTNIRYLSVPVQFENEAGKRTLIGRETFAYEPDDRSENEFVAALDFSSSEGYLLLRGKQPADRIISVESVTGGVSIFQDGIFVTQLDTLLPEGARGLVAGRINLLGEEKCELSMDRNRLFWTDSQQTEMKKKIIHGLIDAVHQMLAALDAQDAPATTRQNIRNILANFFDYNRIDDAMYRRLHPSIREVVEKRFRDFVRINFAHTARQAHVPEADGYAETWQQEVISSFRSR